MGIRKDINEQARSMAHFPAESVLGRMERGGYKPTDEDLADLEKLAATGNRAERRAAGRHLKKHGIAAPEATPRQPIVAPPEPDESDEPAQVAEDTPRAKEAEKPKAPAPVKTSAKTPAAKTPAKKAPAKKTAAKKAPAKKTAAKKTAAKTAAPKKTAVKKTAAKKTAAKKTAAKKTAVKKTAAKKAPAKKAVAKKTARKK